MWSLLGLALVALTQFIALPPTDTPNKVAIILDTAEPNIGMATPKTVPEANEVQKINSPTPKPEPNPTIADQNPAAFNNRSDKLIEQVAAQAIEHSPALVPCIDNNCPSPTPKPTSVIEPTRQPRPSEKPRPTPFPDPVITIIPLPSHEPRPPRCPSIPPHYEKLGPEQPLVADPIYCLD